jgi:antitoxin HigA-1
MTSRSSTTIGAEAEDRLAPVHPGEVLLEDFLTPMGISRYRLAKALGVPAQRIHDLVHGRRAMTADTALRLARFFDMEAQFWMNLQTRYELEIASDVLARRLEQEVKPLTA